MRSPLPAALLLGLLFASSPEAAPISLSNGEARYRIDPATLGLTRLEQSGEIVLSLPAESPFAPESVTTNSERAYWAAPSAGLRFSALVASDGAFELTVQGDPGATIEWPRQPLATGDDLAWPRDSGLLIPIKEPFWRNELTNNEWTTLDPLTMPVWGVLTDGRCITTMISTVFRNQIKFRTVADGLTLQMNHEFHAKSPERSMTFRLVVDSAASPVTPARRYREWLDATGSVVTLEDRAKRVPAITQLLGAPHVYLWGEAAISPRDIRPNQWGPFCRQLVDDAETSGTVAALLRPHFSKEAWALAEEGATAQWHHTYLKRQVADALATALVSDVFQAPVGGVEAARFDQNAKALVAAFPDVFLPIEDWGDGVSMKMIRALEKAGLERLRICLDGWQGIARRPQVASEANRRGWLIGTYDSYHSIHDPAMAGTGQTWPTAQMTPELWQTGGIIRRDGSYLKGFKGTGRKLSPLTARPYFEQRTAAVLAETPFSYYFIDCDAFGEVYDDYNPTHPASMEQDAAERARRLGWLAGEKALVVGSEGGHRYAIGAADVFEGVFGPHFGWGEEALSDKASPYYRGRYFPPHEPEVYFKPAALMEKHRRTHYDPAVRIPLFQTAFHDAAVTTHHWSNDREKHPEVLRQIELLEILWQCPPMLHLSLDTVDKRTERLAAHLANWTPLHRRLGFAQLVDFRHLTADRLVQQTVWADGTRIVVNFGESPVLIDQRSVAGHGFHAFPPPPSM